MSENVIADPRQSRWWGILFPRPTRKASLLSRMASVLIVGPSLLLGLLISCLHILTLPFLIAALLIVHAVRGDARIRSQLRSKAFMSQFQNLART